ncbi:MAG: hypothetical protein J5I90_04685 [Caldilineales bacterium]|nr:hypothetical protein [Caldilineales bacterium]
MSEKSLERRLVEHSAAAVVGVAIGIRLQNREKNRRQQAYAMLAGNEVWGEPFPEVNCRHCGSRNALVGLDDICFSCGRLLSQ